MSRVKNESEMKCEGGVKRSSTFFEIQTPIDFFGKAKKGTMNWGSDQGNFPICLINLNYTIFRDFRFFAL